MDQYTKAKEKLAAVFNQAPWLKTDGKAVHLPISGLPDGHQLTWPELYALYRESDQWTVLEKCLNEKCPRGGAPVEVICR